MFVKFKKKTRIVCKQPNYAPNYPQQRKQKMLGESVFLRFALKPYGTQGDCGHAESVRGRTLHFQTVGSFVVSNLQL